MSSTCPRARGAGEVAALRSFRTREAERLLQVDVRITERTTTLTDGFGDPPSPRP